MKWPILILIQLLLILFSPIPGGNTVTPAAPSPGLPPLPLEIQQGFERVSVGQPPPGAQVIVENKGDAIRVTDEIAARGERALEVIDAPALKSLPTPGFFYVPNHLEGLTRCAFDFYMEKGVYMAHEWRDQAQPRHVGPSLWVRNQSLTVDGRRLLSLPTGQWIHIDVEARLGSHATGTWDLTVQIGERVRHRFPQLETRDSEWTTLHWIGFSSMANQRSIFYLDNLILENSEIRL